MKRTFKSLLVIAASVLAFAACSKVESEIQNEQDFYYTFTLGNPDTKAILASDSQGKYGEWEKGDQIGQAINDANPGYANITLPEGNSPASFQIYKSGGLKVDDVVYTYYPYAASASDKTAIPFVIPVDQSQSGSSLDFDAMPMAGEPFVVTSASTTNQTSVGDIQLANLGSVVDYQVYSTDATYASEIILSVKLSASKAIAGAFTKDITSVKVDDETSLAISGYNQTDVTTTVDSPASIGSSRDAASHVYMVIAPETGVTGSVLVTTNKAKYTFTISSAQTFKRGGLKSFGLNLGNCSNRVAEETAVPVTKHYVLNDYYQANVKVNPLVLDAVVTLTTTNSGNSGKFFGSDPNRDWRLYQTDNAFITVSVASGYELQTIQFTYSVSNTGALEGAASGVVLDVTGNSQTYNVVNTGTVTNGQVRLTAITVKYVPTSASAKQDPTLSFDNPTTSVNIGESVTNEATIDPSSLSASITYSSSDTSIATVDNSTGEVEGVAAGTATITASFAGNDAYNAASDSYVITVSSSLPSGVPGDETFDLSTNTYTTGTNSVTWTGESVVINNSGTNATNYLGGDANNRSSSRFYSDNALVITPNTDYTIASIVFSATSENYANTLKNSTWSNGSASVSGTTVTVTPIDGANAVSATVGGTCGFTSIVVNYVYTGIVVTKYDITIDSGIANGTVSADMNKAAEGATVTLTATPASGYALDAWNVYKTGESGTKVTVTSNSFTMPAYAVTVSASFAAVPTITMNTTSIVDVPAAGVSATAAGAYSLVNGASNANVTITCDGTVVTAASKNSTAGSIDYTVAVNTDVARDGWIKVQYGTEDPHTITVSQKSGATTPTLQYTLDGSITASGNAYGSASTLTQNNIGWSVMGNTEMSPWRIGGKGLSGEDREIYSTTAISANISSIEVESGATASSLSVNSLTITVHNSAADAASGSNAIATKTVTSGIASSTVTFEKEDNTSWAGKYYRIVYNVTRTSTSGNGYISFVSAKFYGI